jgi:ATP-dependent Lon protease
MVRTRSGNAAGMSKSKYPKKKRVVESDSESDGSESLGSEDSSEDEDEELAELERLIAEGKRRRKVRPTAEVRKAASKDISKKYMDMVSGKKSKVYDADEDDEDDDEDDSDYIPKEDIRKKVRKVMSKVYPSKYLKSQVAKDEKNTKKKTKKVIEPESEEEEDDSDDYETYDEEEDDEEDDEDEEEEEEEEEDEDEEVVDSDKINIIFGFGPGGGGDDEDDSPTEDEDEECDSDDEKMFMKETYEQISSSVVTKKEKKAQKEKKALQEKEQAELTAKDNFESEYADLVDTKKFLTEKLRSKPDSKSLLRSLDECKESIRALIKKTRIMNAKAYHKLLNSQKQKSENEMDYFKKKMSNKEQLKIMNDLKEINAHVNVDKPYRLALLESKIPTQHKAIVMQKLNMLRMMDSHDSEYFKLKSWVEFFMRLPFGKYSVLDVNMAHGLDACQGFMEGAMKTLDDCAYGLKDAKMQILQMIGQWIANPAAMGTAIAMKGPMGTGKTTLVKEGISKILNRQFVLIALGGATDGSVLEGSPYVYEGSGPGLITRKLAETQEMNSCFLFDELDKVSMTEKGQEIIGILTHLTDSTQNSEFEDKYIPGIKMDMSRALFLFSYNDESMVNPILKDRMYSIQTKGYTAKEKIIIANNYLLPKIREQVSFKKDEIIIPDDVLEYIINTPGMTRNEDGVRNFKRCLEIIYTKLNLFRLVKSDSNILTKEIDLKVTFPFTVTKKDVDALIRNDEKQSQSLLAMYC